MRALLLVALVGLAVAASAARPCDNGGLIGRVFVPFQAPVPTPGGHTATGAYIDDRAQGHMVVGAYGLRVDLGPSVLGFVAGDGTWLYLETNGVAGLQRGGHSSLPCIGFCDPTDAEFAACSVPNPDELLF